MLLLILNAAEEYEIGAFLLEHRIIVWTRPFVNNNEFIIVLLVFRSAELMHENQILAMYR